MERQLDVIHSVAAGDSDGGAITGLPDTERFGWMTAPASTVVQPGPVHAGICHDPEAALDELFSELVGVLLQH